MMRRVAARLARERGQSMVEFAIVANVGLVVMFLVFQGGVAWYHRLALEEAARDAARNAIVNAKLGQTGMTTLARNTILGEAPGSSTLQQAGAITVTSTKPANSTCTQLWTTDCDLTVTITNYPWKIGVGDISVSGDITVHSTMRIEG
jgi:Flp pilus assembly protein TadG